MAAVLQVVPRAAAQRARLARRARLLAWGGNAWHLVEFAIALGAGIAASSVALVAFGIDSLIEVAAGGVVVWLFTGRRDGSASAERLAQRLIAASFFALAVYIAVDSIRALVGWWWADPLAGVVIAAVAAREGVQSWRGEGCADGCCQPCGP
jgi:divalent metal cation (Fe/Co/Zn/Cd) transporter